MYNLEEKQLRKIQRHILSFYYTSRNNHYRPEMTTCDAVNIFDDCIGKTQMTDFEKTNLVEYLQRNLIRNEKLSTFKGMYRAS